MPEPDVLNTYSLPLSPKHLRTLDSSFLVSKQRNPMGPQIGVPTMVNRVDLESIQLKKSACDRYIADKVECLHGPHCTKAILLLREVAWLRSGKGHSQGPEWDSPSSIPPPSAPTAPTHLAWLLCALANSGALPIAYPLL